MVDSIDTGTYKSYSTITPGDQTPQKPYNINQNYFLHIDRDVPFDLDQVYFTPHITEDGIYFKIDKKRTTEQ